MKQKVIDAWVIFKSAFPFVLTAWFMLILTFLVWRLADPALLATANPILLGLLGSIITGGFVAIHFWFKQRK